MVTLHPSEMSRVYEWYALVLVLQRVNRLMYNTLVMYRIRLWAAQGFKVFFHCFLHEDNQLRP